MAVFNVLNSKSNTIIEAFSFRKSKARHIEMQFANGCSREPIKSRFWDFPELVLGTSWRKWINSWRQNHVLFTFFFSIFARLDHVLFSFSCTLKLHSFIQKYRAKYVLITNKINSSNNNNNYMCFVVVWKRNKLTTVLKPCIKYKIF